MSLSKSGRGVLDSVVTRSAAKGMVQEEPRRPWNEETEEEYLERVRQRARNQAKAILDEAQSQAEAIKAQAYEDGLNSAREEAEASLSAEREGLKRRFEELMQAFEREKVKLREACTGDLLRLLTAAVEKAVRTEFDSRKQEVLENLLGESLALLEGQREIAVSVHEDDLPAMRELIARLQDRGTLHGVWTVRSSTALRAGDLVIETPDGRIDNSLETRMEAVREVLEQIDLRGNEVGGPD